MKIKNTTVTISLLLILTLTSLNPVIGAQISEPDWSTVQFGVPEDENMPLYGEAFVPEYYDIGYAGVGEVHTLTKKQFKETWDRIIKWKNAHGGVWPSYVDISKYKIGVEKIDAETYKKMHDRWDKWKNEHNGEEPDTIGIEGKAGSGGNTQPSTAGSIQTKLMDAVGTFNTFTEFYNLCKGRKYAFYLNNKYSRDAAIKRLKNKEGLNCVDVSQLGYALAKEMGYNVKFQETWCQKDGVGHVLLKVKGKELGNNWVIVDLAACISVNSKASLGHYWCSPPHDAHNNWVE